MCVSPDGSGNSSPSSVATIATSPVFASSAGKPLPCTVSSNVVDGAEARKSSTTLSVSTSPGAIVCTGNGTPIALPTAGGSPRFATSTPFQRTWTRSR